MKIKNAMKTLRQIKKKMIRRIVIISIRYQLSSAQLISQLKLTTLSCQCISAQGVIV
jgi:hypothetical protein